MKKTLKQFAVSAGLIAALSGCLADEPFYTEGEGTLYLSTKLSSDIEVRSRAAVEGLAETCDIWIANEKGIVRQYAGTNEVPSEGIKLVTGNYKVMVWAGDSVPASWSDRFFKGVEPFTLSNGDKIAVTVTGHIANTVVAVNFDSTVGDVLNGYSMTVGHSQGKLTYDAQTEEGKRGYFMMNSRDHDLTWTLKGTKLDGSEYTRTGTIVGAKAATLYKLNVSCTEDDTEYGGAYLDVEIDEETIDKEFDIKIDAAPEIKGIDFDIAQPQRATQNNMGKRSVWITSTSEITSLVLSCDYFDGLFDFGGENDFDFFQMADEELKERIKEAGITYDYETNPQEDNSLLPTIKLTFAAQFTNNLPNGDYPINITVVDKKKKTASAVLHFIVSDASISTNEVEDLYNVWATHAKVSMTVLKDEVQSPVIKLRQKGKMAWENEVIPEGVPVKDAVLTAEFTNLQPGTTYEYCAANGDEESVACEFTTEADAQLPNNSFENWSKPDKAYLIYGAGESMFWDSGNHGSATLSINVTKPTSDSNVASGIKHKGNNAISLESTLVNAVVYKKFAAGNVFIGEYLKTDGTDGVLGWGRPFTSRPRQLRVWARYSPKDIDNVGSGAPGEYVKGQPDFGTIYCALLDGHIDNTYADNTSYPVVIQTKSSSRRLFDPQSANDKPHVIAYGEHVFNASSPATGASDLVEITIDLDYATYNNNIRPSFILLTASASKGGDYFTGGAGSNLVLDDIELVY